MSVAAADVAGQVGAGLVESESGPEVVTVSCWLSQEDDGCKVVARVPLLLHHCLPLTHI